MQYGIYAQQCVPALMMDTCTVALLLVRRALLIADIGVTVRSWLTQEGKPTAIRSAKEAMVLFTMRVVVGLLLRDMMYWGKQVLGTLEGGVHSRPVGMVIILLTRPDAIIMHTYVCKIWLWEYRSDLWSDHTYIIKLWPTYFTITTAHSSYSLWLTYFPPFSYRLKHC